MNKNNEVANPNLVNFAQELSIIVDQPIGLDHIHTCVDGRYYYTQAPKAGAPMLLHHYRGPFFVDIHPDDLKALMEGTVSAHDYIHTANWLVGYYWGGGNMIGGGYYQPMDIVNRYEEVRRYFKILSCRGNRLSSGYMPTEEMCSKCSVQNCPFSKYKTGNWEDEMREPDPRMDLFHAICRRFETGMPDYKVRGYLCGGVEENSVCFSANGHYSDDDPFTFTVYVSQNLVQDLLMHNVEPTDWDEFVSTMRFVYYTSEGYKELTPETAEDAFKGRDYAKARREEEEKQAALEQKRREDAARRAEERKVSFRIARFFGLK